MSTIGRLSHLVEVRATPTMLIDHPSNTVDANGYVCSCSDESDILKCTVLTWFRSVEVRPNVRPHARLRLHSGRPDRKILPLRLDVHHPQSVSTVLDQDRFLLINDAIGPSQAIVITMMTERSIGRRKIRRQGIGIRTERTSDGVF